MSEYAQGGCGFPIPWWAESEATDGAELVSSGGECVGCGRIMSVRERNEQGVCDGCSEGSDK